MYVPNLLGARYGVARVVAGGTHRCVEDTVCGCPTIVAAPFCAGLKFGPYEFESTTCGLGLLHSIK